MAGGYAFPGGSGGPLPACLAQLASTIRTLQYANDRAGNRCRVGGLDKLHMAAPVRTRLFNRLADWAVKIVGPFDHGRHR